MWGDGWFRPIWRTSSHESRLARRSSGSSLLASTFLAFEAISPSVACEAVPSAATMACLPSVTAGTNNLEAGVVVAMGAGLEDVEDKAGSTACPAGVLALRGQ